VVTLAITLVAKDWEDAQAKFFGENGIFTIIHPNKAHEHSPKPAS
jgi:ABC-type sulfate transport system substrate-binding protein